METIKILALVVVGLFALSGVLADLALIFFLILVKHGAEFSIEYNDDEH
jgi:hypothetical protein